MTPKEHRVRLGLSLSLTANMMSVTPRTVLRWEAAWDDGKTPQPYTKALERVERQFRLFGAKNNAEFLHCLAA